MTKLKAILTTILVAVAMAAATPIAKAQNDATAPATLFQYPVAPDTMSSLENRVNYIVPRFWDNYDLSRAIRDTVGFVGAFEDYVDLFRYAHRNIVFTAIKDFMNKAQSNTSNLILIMGIAEQSLFYPGTVYWSDEVYLPFARFFVEAKNVKSEYKLRYRDQIKRIENTLQGIVPPDFTVVKADKSKVKLSDIAGWTLIYFNEPDCFDCTMTRLRLSTDATVNAFVESGELTIVSVYAGSSSAEWMSDSSSSPESWVVGTCDGLDEVYDVRFIPSFYLLDREHKIINKNLTLANVQYLLGGE